MTGRRVLVTGAGGFVGGALVRGFAESEWDVIALDRAFDRDRSGARVRRVTAELAMGVPPDVSVVDLVVHAAWVTTKPLSLGVTPAHYLGLNLRPLLAVLEFAARTRPSAFVFLSSSGVFGPEDGEGGLRDTDQPTGDSPYAVAKRAGELLVPGALPPEVAVHVARLGHLFGPDEVTRPSRRSVSLVAEWLRAAREGRPLAVRSDDPERDWTYTGDLAGALSRLVAGEPVDGPVHVGSGRTLRDGELVGLIASAVPGADVTILPSEDRVKPPMVPSQAPALIGFPWTTPEEGLRHILAHRSDA